MSLQSMMLVTVVVFFTTDAVSGVDVMKAVGDQVSFRPDTPLPLPLPVSSIIWKHRNSSGVIVKAIEWDKDEKDLLIPNPRFQGITHLDNKTGQITITGLKVEHSGVYTIDINSKEQEQRFTLTVKERVPKPVIKKEPIAGNPDVVYLRCEYSEPIIWKNSTGHILKGSAIAPEGESITVTKNGDPENCYTCTLDNGASNETSDPVYERDLFKGVDVMKAVGDQVSFRPDTPLPLPLPVSSIIWKHRNSSGVIVKAIEWDKDEKDLLIPNPRFQGITHLDNKTGQITITGLKVEHSGVYTIDINSKEQEQRFTLTVKERVPKPEIKIEPIAGDPDVVYLRCEYSEPIIWKNSTGHILKGSAIAPEGESITVTKKGDPETFYTCTLDNGASNETSDPVYERDLFKESNKGCVVAAAIPSITMIIIIILVL